MLVLSSPSGAGKTAISRAILDGDAAVTLSVSATTRPQRPGEVDGVDYVFVDDADFAQMVADGAFLEHATVFGHSYGTPREPVEAALAAGRDVLFDVDWQGAQQLAQAARDDLASIFILPPSTAELARRLEARAQDPPEVVAARMAQAAGEMSHWAEYDYVIVNDNLEESAASVRAILLAERLRRTRRVGLVDFVKALSAGR
ncbi:MAG: guanylate kinase [Alphaproteobacteria bacterium]